MATLTETARAFRLTVKVTVACFFLLISYKVGSDIINALRPNRIVEPPQIPPTEIFGKLPKLELNSLTLDLATKPMFSLDLVGAELPEKPQQAKIYPILQAPYGFLALDRAKDLAKMFGFIGEPQRVDSIEYIWSGSNRTLKMNVQSLNFVYTYNYADDPSIFVAGNFFSKEAAQNLAEKVLKDKKLLGGGGTFGGARGIDLVNGTKEVKLLFWEKGKLKKSQSLVQAEVVRVDFFREPLDGFPVLPPNPKEALVNVLVSSLPDDQGLGLYKQTLELNYILWVINRGSFGTYWLKTSSQAWQEFQSTLENLVYLKPEGEDAGTPYILLDVSRFVANNVYLAYFDSEKAQNFLQPIWVFEGKAYLSGGERADWVAYVHAVAAESIE